MLSKIVQVTIKDSYCIPNKWLTPLRLELFAKVPSIVLSMPAFHTQEAVIPEQTVFVSALFTFPTAAGLP